MKVSKVVALIVFSIIGNVFGNELEQTNEHLLRGLVEMDDKNRELQGPPIPYGAIEKLCRDDVFAITLAATTPPATNYLGKLIENYKINACGAAICCALYFCPSKPCEVIRTSLNCPPLAFLQSGPGFGLGIGLDNCPSGPKGP